MDIKEESYFLDLCSENARDTKDLIKKVKIETVSSSSDIKPELKEDSTCCSQNEVHHLMTFNETIKEGENETKIDIKEEHWWLEREDSCINGDIKGETHKVYRCTEPLSLYKEGVPSYTSGLFSSEDLGNDECFSMNKNSSGCGSGIGYQSQKNVIDTSSMERSVSSETPDDQKTVSLASPSKQSKLLQQSNTNKHSNKEYCKSILSHEYRKSNKCKVSKKCSNDSIPLENQASNCDVHDTGLDELSFLKTKKLIDEGKRTYKCNICNKAFTKLSGLKKHKFIHEGIKPHKCNVCNKDFTKLSNLKRHIFIHEGIKPHKCNICNKRFTTLSDVKRHKLIHEGIRPHKCNICKNTFTTLSHLKKHKLIHQGIKTNKCNVCDKAFTTLSDLKMHKLIHESIKPHKCNICSKAFTRSSNLKGHKLIHQGIKPHRCSICKNAFARLSYLKIHKLIHQGLKPHECNICNKTFSDVSNLNKHKLIHESIKPHKRYICKKSFTQSGLKTHKFIHDMKPHKCNICNKGFTHLSSLSRHKLIHKNIVV